MIGDADPLATADKPRACWFAKLKVNAITTKAVQDFLTEVAAVRAPNTVRRIYGVLNALMKLAAQRGYVAVNPCDAVELPTKKRAGIRRCMSTWRATSFWPSRTPCPTRATASRSSPRALAGSARASFGRCGGGT